ncbi:coiled-coil domain-containing protein 40-like [Erpetoichthys calabaricus]|uniref:coiled-coil domain-containing protein 40-like n=1 Tax=Erpetoichthys calabaricus TaxID=27687 RepID=UPI00109EF835|nr:coiled-coil domain-containing protein 40-like [Erpetoichthys calabaricus]
MRKINFEGTSESENQTAGEDEAENHLITNENEANTLQLTGTNDAHLETEPTTSSPQELVPNLQPRVTDTAPSLFQDTSTMKPLGHDCEVAEKMVEEEEKKEEEKEKQMGQEIEETFISQNDEPEGEDLEMDLVVLDPNHPLMKRFQFSLKKHLSKQLDKLNLEHTEKVSKMKTWQRELEELGVILYTVQQDLVNTQMGLEKLHNEKADTTITRKKVEDELDKVKILHKKLQLISNEEHHNVLQLQAEIDNLTQHLLYMEGMTKDVNSEIKTMKYVTQKSETSKAEVEQQKHKQDLLVNKLTKHMDSLRQQIAMYKAQATAQSEEKAAARTAVSEASLEMETICIEKKQIINQWNSCLLGMKHRDEAYTAVHEALGQSKEQVQSLNTEAECCKKSIIKEEEESELMTIILKRVEFKSNITKKKISLCLANQEALNTEYNEYTFSLHEKEQELCTVMADHVVKRSELEDLRRITDKEIIIKVKLEDQIMEKIQEQITLDQAAKLSSQVIEKLVFHKRQLEIDITKVENEVAQITLDCNSLKLKLNSLEKVLDQLDKDILTKDEIISQSEAEIANHITLIDRKEKTISAYNQKVDQIAARQQELRSLRMKHITLTKFIELHKSETETMQQAWLQHQYKLVMMTKEREELTASVEEKRKKLLVLEQKKIRLENEIHQELNEQKDIERYIKNLSNDMEKLSTLLFKNGTIKESLKESNRLMEDEFVQRLREAERESIKIKFKLEWLQEEKNRLLNNLVEAEKQIMLWEKKTYLAKETRAAVDSTVGQGEVHSMKCEIHRMKVLFGQLMRQQEKLTRDMEAVVARRETVVVREEAQGKRDKKIMNRSSIQNKMHILKKRMQDIQKQVAHCDSAIQELLEAHQSLTEILNEKKTHISQLQDTYEILMQNANRLQEIKEKSFCQSLTYQTRQKHLQAIKDGKYVPLVKTKQSLDLEIKKQEDSINSVCSIISRICQEYPEYHGALRKVTLVLAARQQTVKQSA